MSIVKHSKISSLQQLPKRRFSHLIYRFLKFIPAVLLASLLGTYLDLFFVGKGLYEFPKRLFPDIFSINIAFTLFVLPLFVTFFLYYCENMIIWNKIVFITILSLLMSVIEQQSEVYGFFIHHESWKHIYSFYGYLLYLTFIYSFYHILKRQI